MIGSTGVGLLAPPVVERRSTRRLAVREETRFDSADVARPLRSAATLASSVSAARREFRPYESLVVFMGAMATGCMLSLLLFFMIGRVAPWALLTTAFAVYGCAVYLAALNMRDLIHSRPTREIALFGFHLLALLAWPLLTLEWTPASWQWWLGLPASLIALIAFLKLPGAASTIVYRSSALGSLIAGIAVYEYLWRAIGG